MSRLVPGLLQTRDYMEVVPRLDGPEAVASRHSRQRILAKERPPVLRYVIDEYVLRHPVGDAKIMDAQLEYLEQVVSDRLAYVQVAPEGALPWLTGGFVLATVNGRTVGYEEATTHSLVLTEEQDLHHLEVAYGHAVAEAESPARSLERMRRVRNELWRT